MEHNLPSAPPVVNKRLMAGAIVAIVVLVVGVLVVSWLMTPGKVSAPGTGEVSSVSVVEIRDNGFVPATIKVKLGSTVRWLNKTAGPHQVASNPYPERTDLPGLYSGGPIGPGQDYEYVFDQAGTWGYNDPARPTVGGTVVVE